MKKSLFVLALMVAIPLQARVFLPETISEFYQLLDEHEIAIVHFVQMKSSVSSSSAAEKVDTSVQEADQIKSSAPLTDVEKEKQLKVMKAAFRTLSRKKDFERAGLAFIGVNLDTMPGLERAFPVTNNSTLMIFEQGIVMKNPDGTDAALIGFVDEDKIENFIELHVGHYVDQAEATYQAVKRGDDQMYSEDVETPAPTVVYRQPRYQVVNRVYEPASYYYPRYSYPGYYRSWGYGYPYRRWGGWGPGFGLGFGFGGRRGGIGFGFGF